MQFSISRFQHSQPSFPCEVGGYFWSTLHRHYLRDAKGALELTGPVGVFAALAPGALVMVRLVEQREGLLVCDEARLLTAPKAEPADLRAGQSAEFARFVRVVRDFFVRRGLDEVATPSLVPCPGLEPSLEPFSLLITRGRDTRPIYLPTSPEIHLKKALARGWTDIFEIHRCFRQGEYSPHHTPEFLMLEWYRAFADLDLVLEDLQALLVELVKKKFTKQKSLLKITTFAALFADGLHFTLTPTTTARELQTLCERLEVETATSDTFDDLFHRLLLAHIEPRLAPLGPLVIRDFPPSQAALARLTADGWADRFELYWNGLEIANAFNEVTDPAEQARRWEKEQRERLRLGTTRLEPDAGLIAALEKGMPPTGGIALGMERLFMACTGTAEIRELRLFADVDLF